MSVSSRLVSRCFPAVTVITLEVLTGVYVLGVFRCWLRTGVNRGMRLREVLAFAGALLSLGVALVSPLDTLATALFSAHMVQHLLLILVVPPLLIWSELPKAILYALPRRTARRVAAGLRAQALFRRLWELLTHPVSAWSLFTALLWIWHLPAFYQAALVSEAIHLLEHGCLIAAALLFWWVLLHPGGRRSVRYGIAIPYLFLSAIQGGLLGALLTFSPRVWYPIYTGRTVMHGLTPLQDQQLAGVLMWLPVGTLFTVLAAGYLLAWFAALDAEMQRP